MIASSLEPSAARGEGRVSARTKVLASTRKRRVTQGKSLPSNHSDSSEMTFARVRSCMGNPSCRANFRDGSS